MSRSRGCAIIEPDVADYLAARAPIAPSVGSAVRAVLLARLGRRRALRGGKRLIRWRHEVFLKSRNVAVNSPDAASSSGKPHLPSECPHPSKRSTQAWSRRRRDRARPGAARAVALLGDLEVRLASSGWRARVGALGWLFGGASRSRSGALHLGLGRPRQDHADGPVLRLVAVQAPARAFPRIPGRCAWAHPCLSASASRPGEVKDPDPGPIAAELAEESRAALLRRVHRDRHRRRDDPRAAVHGAVRGRRRRGRDLECRAVASSMRAG